jgi:diadenylate cyclase
MVIRIIRESRAMQLVKGFIFLAILYAVVNFLGMGASSYMLKSIFSNILIIIAILFGPEIRNILEHMGKGAARNSFKAIIHSGVALDAVEMNKTIDAVIKACANMADDKIGALIVFENETPLGDIISSGTVIDAKASRELIENVFFPKAALHDGAMIIRGDSVYAAGCILPLTRDTNISSALGTRHRAAIGLSQQSDAIVFVVSEETGEISVAMNGTLRRNISTGDMRDVLTGLFVPSGTSSDDKVISKLVRRFKK